MKKLIFLLFVASCGGLDIASNSNVSSSVDDHSKGIQDCTYTLDPTSLVFGADGNILSCAASVHCLNTSADFQLFEGKAANQCGSFATPTPTPTPGA
jgi:hypothetical protein